jgi:hypothetical protein
MDHRVIGMGGCGLDSTGSGQGPVADCCDETSGSCATELEAPSLHISFCLCYVAVITAPLLFAGLATRAVTAWWIAPFDTFKSATYYLWTEHLTCAY